MQQNRKLRTPKSTEYSEKYRDAQFEYRHVTICKVDFDRLPQSYREFYLGGSPDLVKQFLKIEQLQAAVGTSCKDQTVKNE